jgi:hypothetical protein
MSFEWIFFALFFGVIAYFIYSIIRHRGFKGAMFGAEVLSSVGAVSSPKRGLMSQKLKVHILGGENPAERSVGLELTSSGPGFWSMTPIRLPTSEAKKLITLLEQAVARDVGSVLPPPAA